MALPPVRVQSATSGLVIIDYRSAALTSEPAGADGLVSVWFEPVPSGLIWLLGRLSVSTDATLPTRCMVYAGTPSPSTFLDGTDGGNLDTADNATACLVESNSVLSVQWSGVDVGCRGTARVQYQVVSRS